MAIKVVQMCDLCGRDRTLGERVETEKRAGGWRELEAGSRRATLCNVCIGNMITAIAAGVLVVPAAARTTP